MVLLATYLHFEAIYGAQLSLSGIPKHLWQTLFYKLTNEIFDAGDYFLLSPIDDNDTGTETNASIVHRTTLKAVVSNEDGLRLTDNELFLIDHAWTYKLSDARSHLDSIPGLRERMVALMEPKVDSVDAVMEAMWRYNNTYSILAPGLDVEQTLPVWYVMDEFGSRIRHCDEPSFRLVPFYYAEMGCAFSVLFPVVDVEYGDEVTRDYAEASVVHKPELKEYYLLPWIHRDFSNHDCNFVIEDDSFFTSGRENELLPEKSPPDPKKTRDPMKKLKIFTEYPRMTDSITDDRFEVVDDKLDADVWWLVSHFKHFVSLASDFPDVMVNQFPFESVLTVKDLFAAVVHNAFVGSATDQDTLLTTSPKWICPTFNLKTELPQFVSYFQRREQRNLDNHWILKPWNLARSLDSHVCKNLGQIIRLHDSGPKVACKYLDNSVLFLRPDNGLRVKIDLRYIVFLTSVQPLQAYVYDNFWLRFALKEFSLDRLDDYEKHFTVFNYLGAEKILQMYCGDFVQQFEAQYPDHPWSEIQDSINQALKESLECATRNSPPKGIAANGQCGAMYGVDLMLNWDQDKNGDPRIQPIILEFNFAPDCDRACDYYPDFMNTVFEVLFCGLTDNLSITKLC